MLVTTLLIALAAQSLTTTVDTTRGAFTKCLRVHMKTSLEAKMPEAEYVLTVTTTCAAERAAFRKAMIALDSAMGDSAADAADSAEMQIEDYHATFTDKFKDHVATNTLPAE